MEIWTLGYGARRIAGTPQSREQNDEERAATPGILASLEKHQASGKGIAYYRNEDLGHWMIGHVVGLTYGTPEAQFETADPPQQCPDGLMRDITGGINWRYRLVAVTPPKEG